MRRRAAPRRRRQRRWPHGRRQRRALRSGGCVWRPARPSAWGAPASTIPTGRKKSTPSIWVPGRGLSSTGSAASTKSSYGIRTTSSITGFARTAAASISVPESVPATTAAAACAPSASSTTSMASGRCASCRSIRGRCSAGSLCPRSSYRVLLGSPVSGSLVRREWHDGACDISGTYLAADLASSARLARRHGWHWLPLLPAVFATLHLSYGLGFLAGLVRFAHRWRERRGYRAAP